RRRAGGFGGGSGGSRGRAHRQPGWRSGPGCGNGLGQRARTPSTASDSRRVEGRRVGRGPGAHRGKAPHPMKKPVRLDPEAEAELTEAIVWYEDRRPGLGARLARAVDARLTAIVT